MMDDRVTCNGRVIRPGQIWKCNGVVAEVDFKQDDTWYLSDTPESTFQRKYFSSSLGDSDYEGSWEFISEINHAMQTYERLRAEDP